MREVEWERLVDTHLDGELDESSAKALMGAMQSDPALAEDYVTQQAFRRMCKEAWAPVKAPSHLRARVLEALDKASGEMASVERDDVVVPLVRASAGLEGLSASGKSSLDRKRVERKVRTERSYGQSSLAWGVSAMAVAAVALIVWMESGGRSRQAVWRGDDQFAAQPGAMGDASEAVGSRAGGWTVAPAASGSGANGQPKFVGTVRVRPAHVDNAKGRAAGHARGNAPGAEARRAVSPAGDPLGSREADAVANRIADLDDVVAMHASYVPVASGDASELAARLESRFGFPVRPVLFRGVASKLTGVQAATIGGKAAATMYYEVGNQSVTVVVTQDKSLLQHAPTQAVDGKQLAVGRVDGRAVPIRTHAGLVYMFAADVDEASLLSLAANADFR